MVATALAHLRQRSRPVPSPRAWPHLRRSRSRKGKVVVQRVRRSLAFRVRRHSCRLLMHVAGRDRDRRYDLVVEPHSRRRRSWSSTKTWSFRLRRSEQMA